MLVRHLMPILLFMLICSSPLHAAQKPAANEALAELGPRSFSMCGWLILTR